MDVGAIEEKGGKGTWKGKGTGKDKYKGRARARTSRTRVEKRSGASIVCLFHTSDAADAEVG